MTLATATIMTLINDLIGWTREKKSWRTCNTLFGAFFGVVWQNGVKFSLATFRLQYEDDYEYEFSVLSTRFKFEGRKLSKCACSELETRTRSRPRTPIWRSLFLRFWRQREPAAVNLSLFSCPLKPSLPGKWKSTSPILYNVINVG